MPNYYGVNEILNRSRKLGPITRTKPAIREDEVLVGVAFQFSRDNNVYQAIAPSLTDQRQYDEYFRQSEQGRFARVTLYALPKHLVDKCPDQGALTIPERNFPLYVLY